MVSLNPPRTEGLMLALPLVARSDQTPAPACRLEIERMVEDYEYVQDGDIVIGGVVTVNNIMYSISVQYAQFKSISACSKYVSECVISETCNSWKIPLSPDICQHKNLMAFFHSVDEINKNPSILPNLTLGYHIYDSCADPKKAIKSILQILSGPGNVVPNYSCTKKKVVGFIGDHFSSTTIPIAQLMWIYPYTQFCNKFSMLRMWRISCTQDIKEGNFGDFHKQDITDLAATSRKPSSLRATPKKMAEATTELKKSIGVAPGLKRQKIIYAFLINNTDTDPLLSDRHLFPSFFRTVPDEYTTYSVICHFLNYFGWNWVGIITSDDDAGEKEVSLLTKVLARHEICVEFVIKGRYSQLRHEKNIEEDIDVLDKSSAEVIILCGTPLQIFTEYLHEIVDLIHKKTLIFNPELSPNWKYYGEPYAQIINLSLSFFLRQEDGPDIENNYKSPHPFKYPKDSMTVALMFITYNVTSLKEVEDKMYETHFQKQNETGELDELLHVDFGKLKFQVYSAVLSLAMALNNMYNYHGHPNTDQLYQHRHKLKKYVEALMCLDEFGKEYKCFTEKGYKVFDYNINNPIILNGRLSDWNTVGQYVITSTDDLYFWVDKKNILWKNNANEIPWSRCSERCKPGDRKVASSSTQLCCYGCVPCSEGEISNISDSKNCMKCPEDSWPNENGTFCVLKEMEYLSYTEDILSSAFSCLSSFFCILTILIFAIFVSKRDTPIVRANNKNLSFVLLVSIMLSFLCVFLFLGRPVDITCMLRQISTGILLSVSISSLLAKTIMVCIAFKATKPGSVWRRWIGVKLPNSVLLICSSVQVVLCMSWVTLSPPFQELDTHSYKEKTVVQCNEGSDLWFYSVLGYMGILAAISFIIAFLVRTLPDSFNEAKYITFSMLVFCSVWIAMIPAYLSTKGKYMVAVEIFAILTSNAGLLGCIFIPKCYIILLKPELNTRKRLLEPKNTVLHH
ncbi:vomeronasal type-2 receptor 26-like [Leptodactylus fuscus]